MSLSMSTFSLRVRWREAGGWDRGWACVGDGHACAMSVHTPCLAYAHLGHLVLGPSKRNTCKPNTCKRNTCKPKIAGTHTHTPEGLVVVLAAVPKVANGPRHLRLAGKRIHQHIHHLVIRALEIAQPGTAELLLLRPQTTPPVASHRGRQRAHHSRKLCVHGQEGEVVNHVADQLQGSRVDKQKGRAARW